MSLRTRNDPFLVMAGLYLTVGLLAIVGKLAVDAGLMGGLPRLRWLTIHFVTIGGLTQALFGLLPVVGAVGRTSWSISRRFRWLQWLSLNAGYPLILVGMATGESTVAVVGATLVLGALGGLLLTVTSLVGGGTDSGHFFRTAPWYLVVGILAAFGMLLNVHGPGGYFGSIEAHVHANVWGFLALVVAGVLLVALPELFGTDLRYPRLGRVTYWGLTVGAAGLVAGPWLARNELTMAGLAIYVVGTVALLANVVGTYRASSRTQPNRLALVLGAYLWLIVPVPVAPFVLLFPEAVPAAAIEQSAINGLVFGWMLQLAMAFLPLATVAITEETSNPLGGLAAASEAVGQPSWWQIGSINLGMALLWVTALPQLAGVSDLLSLTGYGLIAVAWAVFLVELWAVLTAPVTANPSHDPSLD
ncbi:hypothetical protein [Natronomonas amylolytica]|uniref:hypothetical protein n=1 Tax=Natronomonas amylolytica TaxID=3108498 RepID=UPI003009714A